LIWRITPEDQTINPDGYTDYAFLIEYNLPLRLKTEPANDIHNYIEYNVSKSKHPSEVLFDCDIIINENKSMVFYNCKYRFYLQSTGNLVVKEDEKILRSSNTAIDEPFEGPLSV